MLTNSINNECSIMMYTCMSNFTIKKEQGQTVVHNFSHFRYNLRTDTKWIHPALDILCGISFIQLERKEDGMKVTKTFLDRKWRPTVEHVGLGFSLAQKSRQHTIIL